MKPHYLPRTLDVFVNTRIIAEVMDGLDKKTAKATSTINITYSTIVWPFSRLRFLVNDAR